MDVYRLGNRQAFNVGAEEKVTFLCCLKLEINTSSKQSQIVLEYMLQNLILFSLMYQHFESLGWTVQTGLNLSI